LAAVYSVAVGLSSLLPLIARSAPPLTHSVALVTRLGGPLQAAHSAAAGRPHRVAGPLDLRAPDLNATASRMRSPANSSVPHESDDDRYQSRTSKLSSDEFVMQSKGRVQELAQRVRREGVPIARLWESHSALVSLGLNSRGKPGLWLIQKTH
jgi:hypothetical protein